MIHAIGAAHAVLRAKVKRSTPQPFEVELRKRRRSALDKDAAAGRRDADSKGGERV